MMGDRGKKIEVNVSSLVDLKAELLRKQEEFRRQKLENSSGSIRGNTIIKKPTIWSKKNVGVLERAQNDLEEKREETDVLSRVKSKLEAKSEIYNQMAKGGALLDEDCSKNFLVDFEQKSLDLLIEKKRENKAISDAEKARRLKEDEEERRLLSEKLPEPVEPEDQWVDYVDSFGRTRRCLRKDLPHLADQDKKHSVTRTEKADSLDLLSADMKRELQRQEWEKQAQDEIDSPTGPLHYSDVRFSEKREHGVGFFEFAKDEDTRQQQLEALKKLRQQTEEQRHKTERLKEKRKALMQTRLAKVKQRKTVLDLPDLDFDPLAPEAAETPSTTVEAGQKEPEIQGNSTAKKSAPVREWDRGKRFDETSWLADRRDERQNEFAPPSTYLDSMSSTSKQREPVVKRPNKTLLGTQKASSATSASDIASCPSLEEDIGMKLSAIRNRLASNVSGSFDRSHATSTSSSVHVDADTTVDLEAMGQCESTASPAPDVESNVVHYPYPPTGHSAATWNELNWSSKSYMDVAGYPFSTTVGMSLDKGCDVQAAEEFEGTSFDEVHRVDNDPSSGQLPFIAPPQPVHYSSAPSLPQPKQSFYERVLLHELPATLPAPPSTASLQYPSQEEVIGPRRKQERREIDEQAAIKSWYRQFDRNWQASKNSSASSSSVLRNEVSKGQIATEPSTEPASVVLKPKNIPFASPYIQAQDAGSNARQTADEVKYDPSIPPPIVDS